MAVFFFFFFVQGSIKLKLPFRLFQNKGVPSSFTSREELSNIIYRLLWWATGEHATINYPLKEHSTLIQQEPAAIYSDLEEFSELSPKEQLERQMDFLPPKSEAVVSEGIDFV